MELILWRKGGINMDEKSMREKLKKIHEDITEVLFQLSERDEEYSDEEIELAEELATLREVLEDYI